MLSWFESKSPSSERTRGKENKSGYLETLGGLVEPGEYNNGATREDGIRALPDYLRTFNINRGNLFTRRAQGTHERIRTA